MWWVSLLGGMTLGWIATYPTENRCIDLQLEYLDNELDRVHFFIDTILGCGAIFGWTLAGIYTDKFGRIWTIETGASFAIVGWCCIAFSSNTMLQSSSLILAGRWLTGAALGILSISLPVFLLERSSRKSVGKCILWLPIGSFLGSCCCYWLSQSLSLQGNEVAVLAGSGILPPIVLLFLMEYVVSSDTNRFDISIQSTDTDCLWLFYAMLLILLKAIAESCLLALLEQSLVQSLIMFTTGWISSMPINLWLFPGWNGVAWFHLFQFGGYILSFLLIDIVGWRKTILIGSFCCICSTVLLLFFSDSTSLGTRIGLILDLIGINAGIALVPIVLLPQAFSTQWRVSMLCFVLLIEWIVQQYLTQPLKLVLEALVWEKVLAIQFVTVGFTIVLSLLLPTVSI